MGELNCGEVRFARKRNSVCVIEHFSAFKKTFALRDNIERKFHLKRLFINHKISQSLAQADRRKSRKLEVK